MPHHTRDGVVPWPPEVAARYRAAGYWLDRTLGDLLWETADARRDEVAVVDAAQQPATRLTYGELTARADAAALRLGDLGLEPDDRLLVQLPNGWEFVVLTLACFRSGVIPVMALPAHRRHELEHLASVSEARAIAVPGVLRGFDHQGLAHELAVDLPDLAHVLVLGEPTGGAHDLAALLAPPAGADAADLRARVDALDPDPASPACFLISGGTTGLPKLITRTHDDYACNVRATAATCALGPDDVYLGTLPASHNFPLACPGVLGTLLVGGRVVMLPSPEPERAMRTIEAEGVTVSAAVPAVAQAWVDHRQAHPGAHDLSTLRVLQVGGSRLPDAYAARIAPVLGCTLQQVFGMAEGLINTTRLDDPEEAICRTQGRPVHEADEVRILDPLGADLPDGEPGSIVTRGPYTPRGYYRAPAADARAFVDDGWYASGDVVLRRSDGNLVVQGRDKDMINRGGEKISAEEVETLVYAMDAAEMVAAVSMPDERLGERLCVYVVPKAGHEVTLEAVRAHFDASGVAAYKWPERLELVTALPMTKVGKIDKKALRERLTLTTAGS
ncbi:(2,3-dihydroxybenzoyl)adenylate synthase [Nocardioides sp. CFH 31398]|uniref:(2,3-dihydroxybenzoyl)adenylate synthase n=1 Tax=Nocardioides sp. CFH 31398 TaxID=2919579 RepID=UPI001F06C66A|nr:AMP-binding protein [Nocardioides sp. CFH 31398]MCH1865467.1 AMP-binding protein [Nocardioides sp. CFH 31398]